jgi:hypothetical protein
MVAAAPRGLGGGDAAENKPFASRSTPFRSDSHESPRQLGIACRTRPKVCGGFTAEATGTTAPKRTAARGRAHGRPLVAGGKPWAHTSACARGPPGTRWSEERALWITANVARRGRSARTALRRANEERMRDVRETLQGLLAKRDRRP